MEYGKAALARMSQRLYHVTLFYFHANSRDPYHVVEDNLKGDLLLRTLHPRSWQTQYVAPARTK